MKIIFLNRFFHPDNSATSQMMSDQAFALARHGHEVIVITARQTYANPKDRRLAHARIPGVTVHRPSSFGRARLVRIGDGVLRKLRDASLRAAHKNVVLGAVMQRDVERLKVPASRIVQIPNWTNGEAIKPIARAQNAHRADWDLDDAFGIAHAGNLVRAHDASAFLAAMEHLEGSPIVAANVLPPSTA